MKRRTLESAFRAGFLAGQVVVHSQDVFDQEEDYFKAWKRDEEHWCTKTLDKYQKMDME